MVEEGNLRIKDLFASRGRVAKSFDDWETPEFAKDSPPKTYPKKPIPPLLENLQAAKWFRKKLIRIKRKDPNIYPLF